MDIEKRFFKSYQDFLDGVSTASNLIFRGHSNIGGFWKINSSFSRLDNERLYKDFLPIGYEFLPMRGIIRRYERIPNQKKLLELNNIELLQYLQHYGIPTPLIDFTKDANIALYFAGSGITYRTLRSSSDFMEIENNSFSQIEKRFILSVQPIVNNKGDLELTEYEELFRLLPQSFVNIIQIDVKALAESNLVSSLDNQELDFSKHKEIYVEDYDEDCEPYELKAGIFSILNPNEGINRNLFHQKGAFVYFDANVCLDSFFHWMKMRGRIENSPITHNLILKSSLNNVYGFINREETLYQYLKQQKCTGADLFENDVQGLRYDLNYLSGE